MTDASEDEERAKLVHNEQIKIRATLLNTIAAGFVIAGVISPLAAVTVSGSGVSWLTLLLMAVALLVAATLHYAANLTLERLR